MNCEYPEFDESILTISGTEVVRPVKTTPLHEFKFRDYCKENGLVSYLPLRRVWRVRNQTSTKGKTYSYSKEVLRPMFTGYVFVKIPLERLRGLFETKLVTKILHVADLDAFMEEVKTVRKVELVGFKQELEFNADIAVGDRFQIQSGVWEGVTGWLTCRDRKFKWTVQIEFVNQTVTTTINPSKFKMIKLEN
jgi:transcription antitermination factor NusG